MANFRFEIKSQLVLGHVRYPEDDNAFMVFKRKTIKKRRVKKGEHG